MDPACCPDRLAVLAIGRVPVLAELSLHLVRFGALLRRQHLIELRRSFGPNRHQLPEKLSLLIGERLNLGVALVGLGGGSQRFPTLFQLLANGLGGLPGLLENGAALLFLSVGQVELLGNAAHMAPHETTPAFLRLGGSGLL